MGSNCLKPFFLCSLILLGLVQAALAADFPESPDQGLTPGSLCDKPDSHRYPENIAYCSRDVSTRLKAQIFDIYRTELGYKLDLTNRKDYKIDHFIPLCAGGSNKKNNLWPQHVTIFTLTDPLEGLGCEKLALGKIRQKALIDLIRRAKEDLREVPQVLEQLNGL